MFFCKSDAQASKFNVWLTNIPKPLSRLSVASMLLCTSLLGTLPVSVAADEENEALKKFGNALPANIQQRIARNPERFLREIAPVLYSISPDGVVTQRQLDLRDAKRRADARAKRLADILRYDIDGDGGIDADELTKLLPTLPVEDRGTLSVYVIQNDKDKDGALSFEEILSAVNAREKAINSGSSSSRIRVMAFDYNGDNKVDLPEIAKVIAAFDPPGIDMNKMKVTPAAKPSKELCDVPPSEGAKGVLVSLQAAEALSTLTVAGQDRVTSVAVVTIGEGSEPLYLFATSDKPVIWKFEGATDRIKHLVLQPGIDDEPFGAAAAGVDRDRITFVPPGACARRAIRSRKGQDRYDTLKLQNRLGVKFEHFAIARAVSHLNVPWVDVEKSLGPRKKKAYGTPVRFSIGENEYSLSENGMALLKKPLKDGDQNEPAANPQDVSKPVRSMMHLFPDGLIPLDVEEVHASGLLEPYTVLPSQAGLLQLMAEGRIIHEDGFYIIEKEIERFPGGMFGSRSARFILEAGVPMPEGTPGHSPVVSGETGECLTALIACRD